MKNEESKKTKNRIFYIIILILCIIIAIIARIFNFGWFTLIFGIFIITIHFPLFFVSNYIIAKNANNSGLAKLLFWLSCLTFLAFYILNPDYSDVNGYAVFGQIKDYNTVNILGKIARFVFCINIIILFLGFFTKKIIKKDNEQINN